MLDIASPCSHLSSLSPLFSLSSLSRRIGLTPCQGQAKINGHAVYNMYINLASISLILNCLKRNFPMAPSYPSVGRLFGRSVGQSKFLNKKCRMLHCHAPIGALVQPAEAAEAAAGAAEAAAQHRQQQDAGCNTQGHPHPHLHHTINDQFVNPSTTRVYSGQKSTPTRNVNLIW